MPKTFQEWIREHGEPMTAGSNRPLFLDEPAALWWIETGAVEMFVVEVTDGSPAGARSHLVHLGPGQIFLGLPPGLDHGLLAVGTFGTRWRRVTWQAFQSALTEPDLREEAGRLIDRWLASLSIGLSQELPPKEFVTLQAAAEAPVQAGQAARPSSVILWSQADEGTALYNHHAHLAIDLAAGWHPVSSDHWLVPQTNVILRIRTTADLAATGELEPHLHKFHALALRWAAMNLAAAKGAETTRLTAKAASRRQAVADAVQALSGALNATATQGAAADEPAIPILAACRLVGNALGVTFRLHPDLKGNRPVKDPLGKMAAASRLRLRRVVLSDGWWTHDTGPLLGFRQADDAPLALLPASASSYVIADPADGSRAVITAENAQDLKPIAYTFYRPLASGALKVMDVVRFGLVGCQKDLLTIFLMGLAAGLLGLLTPIATGIVFDRVIPGAERGPLFHITAGLLVAAIAGVMFQITRSVALLRVETRSDASIQGAVWDRLLSLPLPFFRQFTSGDLASRANGINTIRRIMSDSLVNVVLGGLSSLFSFALLFYYSLPLAILAVVLVMVSIAATLAASLLHLRFQTPVYQLQGKISGLVLQFITGVSKLRVAGAEGNALAVWARNYAAEKQYDWKAAMVGNAFAVFDTVFPPTTAMVLFAGMAHLATRGMSTGDFLAFNAAFGGFLGSMLALSSSILSLFDAIPIYDRARPILEARPEIDEAKADPGNLGGGIELNNLRFRYRSDGPLILQDLSLSIEPGEFVAIVGPSGSGKSTLMRLLLGFERPEAGTIYYDGMDLAGLDVQAVRRQFGVVLQTSKLMPGSIFENIVGSSLLTLEDAWTAAEQAGLADDIEAMPMGMHTVLGEGAGTLSGGQRQRLMIARAIVARPRILLFDEATSALDNRTQAVVSQSLERLHATRIVIAHRLSTIMNADRIAVLQGGRLIQSGTYRALVEQPGLFSELARRQLA